MRFIPYSILMNTGAVQGHVQRGMECAHGYAWSHREQVWHYSPHPTPNPDPDPNPNPKRSIMIPSIMMRLTRALALVSSVRGVPEVFSLTVCVCDNPPYP